MFWKWALKLVLKFFAGLTAADFNKVLKWVATAQTSYRESEDKRNYVTDLIKRAWPKLAEWAVNLVRELAVARLKKGEATE